MWDLVAVDELVERIAADPQQPHRVRHVEHVIGRGRGRGTLCAQCRRRWIVRSGCRRMSGAGSALRLTREETGRLTANVHSLLSEFSRGWWIVRDFAFKTEIRGLPPERIQLREAITGVTQRQLDASAFENSADLESFFHRAGFDVQVCSQVDKTPSFSTIAALKLSPTVIERMRPVLRVWVMTPSLAGSSGSARW